MPVFINPGSGPVADASEDNAKENIKKFVEDVALDGVQVRRTKADRKGDSDGRFTFTLLLGKNRSQIDMPGLPLEQVRFTGEGDQNIWDFPRLYENGSSWVWKYAVTCARSSLLGEE